MKTFISILLSVSILIFPSLGLTKSKNFDTSIHKNKGLHAICDPEGELHYRIFAEISGLDYENIEDVEHSKNRMYAKGLCRGFLMGLVNYYLAKDLCFPKGTNVDDFKRVYLDHLNNTNIDNSEYAYVTLKEALQKEFPCKGE